MILDSSYQFKTKVFYPVLNRIPEELKRRFSSVNDVVYNGIDALCPMSKQFFNQTALQKFALHYKTVIGPTVLDSTTDDDSNKLKMKLWLQSSYLLIN